MCCKITNRWKSSDNLTKLFPKAKEVTNDKKIEDKKKMNLQKIVGEVNNGKILFEW